jgi:hypothetical protein
MTIKAVLRDGRIQPVEPLPSGWRDGQQLVVEEPEADAGNTQLDEWESNLARATAQIPADEHDRFLLALDEIEIQSKEAIRREWKLL